MATYSPTQLKIKAPSGGFQQGGWYNGRQYWNGSLSDPGVIHPESNQQGAGQAVNKEVIAASNTAQGLAQGTNEAYLKQQAQIKPAPAPTVTPAPNSNPAGNTTTDYSTAGNGTSTGAFATAKPTINLQQVYDSAFKTPEIEAGNLAVTNAAAEIDKEQKAFDEQMAIIADNPLYSASRMTGKQAKLQDKFNANLSRLQKAKDQVVSDLAIKKADAEVKVNLAMKQYDINNQSYKDQLDLFSSLLKEGALTNASGTDIASYAVATGIPASMIQNIVAKQKKDEIKPTVLNNTDDNGNVTVTIIDQMTGDVLSKSSLGRIDKSKAVDKSDTKDQELVANLQTMIGDIQAGANLRDLINHYTDIGKIPIDTVYSYYNQYSKINGPATETLEEVKNRIFYDK